MAETSALSLVRLHMMQYLMAYLIHGSRVSDD